LPWWAATDCRGRRNLFRQSGRPAALTERKGDLAFSGPSSEAERRHLSLWRPTGWAGVADICTLRALRSVLGRCPRARVGEK